MRLSNPRNGPSWDLPPSAAALRTYVLASTPRTGSTLLANALTDTGRAAVPREYLGPMQIRDFALRFGGPASRLGHALLVGPLVAIAGTQMRPEGARAHLARAISLRTAADGWFGLKLHHHQFARWWPAVADLLGPVRFIHVSRRDRVAQAVSWERALQTGRWASFQRGWRPALYSRRRIAARVAAIERAEAGWEAAFAARGVAPLRIVYEDLAADLGAGVAAALRHLGLPDEIVAPAPATARQADATSARWIARFRAEHHARGQGARSGSGPPGGEPGPRAPCEERDPRHARHEHAPG